MQILNTYTITIGKFLNGIFVTCVHIAVTKMVNETVPVYLLGTCGTVTQSMMSSGYLLVLGLGCFLPEADYDPEKGTQPQNIIAK